MFTVSTALTSDTCESNTTTFHGRRTGKYVKAIKSTSKATRWIHSRVSLAHTIERERLCNNYQEWRGGAGLSDERPVNDVVICIVHLKTFATALITLVRNFLAQEFSIGCCTLGLWKTMQKNGFSLRCNVIPGPHSRRKMDWFCNLPLFMLVLGKWNA